MRTLFIPGTELLVCDLIILGSTVIFGLAVNAKTNPPKLGLCASLKVRVNRRSAHRTNDYHSTFVLVKLGAS